MGNWIVLCEGETDQALIGCYLERVMNWEYMKNEKKVPLPQESIVWYKKKENINGVWQVGGNDFCEALHKIMAREKLDHFFKGIVIITDHDDESAETDRIKEIKKAIKKGAEDETLDPDISVNAWRTIRIRNSFGIADILILYLLVPLDERGALETYMMKALSEQSQDKGLVIGEAKRFVDEFHSDVYLRKRRERTKAELGVSMAIFSPDRIFTTMKELIDSVDWERFSITHKQFELLNGLL